MSAEEMRTVERGGTAVGSQTVSHTHLSALDADQIHRDVIESRAILEDTIRFRVTDFAYPYREVTPREVDPARVAGDVHASAVEQQPGSRGTFAVQRTGVSDADGSLRPLAKGARVEYRRARGTTR
ncbi:polysaccharide deacetylase family protein [Actinomycetospora straminea]|uniref:NodB homology domain-containing protein n=1 Tax=Actinomycetospora straminea TaxID=663607 RepID=A0ABP9DZK7_9PSEU|nr:polysaccharide deacetylase family protein [Actinomycetospora straminea]MDD7931034.1 polysaccharide deacetylase family protein [Actinomycetospora straminea]